MKIIKKILAPIGKEGEQLIAMLLSSKKSKELLACTLYPRIDGRGWIYALPAQKGCITGCKFCSVPCFFGDLMPKEIFKIIELLNIEGKLNGFNVDSGNSKISFIKGGELLLNNYFLEILNSINNQKQPFDIKISSVLPKMPIVEKNLEQMFKFYENFSEEKSFCFQISLLSTSEEVRNQITKIPLMSFKEISEIGKKFYETRKRKITITLLTTNELICDPKELFKQFSPEYFVVRLFLYKKNTKNLESMELEHIYSLEKKFVDLGYKVIFSKNKYSDEERENEYLDSHNKLFH